MDIEVKCPACAAIAHAPAAAEGKRGRCRRCGQVMLLAPAEHELIELAPAPIANTTRHALRQAESDKGNSTPTTGPRLVPTELGGLTNPFTLLSLGSGLLGLLVLVVTSAISNLVGRSASGMLAWSLAALLVSSGLFAVARRASRRSGYTAGWQLIRWLALALAAVGLIVTVFNFTLADRESWSEIAVAFAIPSLACLAVACVPASSEHAGTRPTPGLALVLAVTTIGAASLVQSTLHDRHRPAAAPGKTVASTDESPKPPVQSRPTAVETPPVSYRAHVGGVGDAENATPSTSPSAGTADAVPRTSPSWEAATSLAKQVEQDLRGGRVEQLARAMDLDRFFSRVCGPYEPPAQGSAELKRAVGAEWQQWCSQFSAIRPHATTKLLRVRQVNGGPRAVFRYVTVEGELTYFELVFGLSPQGSVIVEDVYHFGAGALNSEVTAIVVRPVLHMAMKGSVNGLNDVQKDVVKHHAEIVTFLASLAQGKHQEAISVYEAFPATIQQIKHLSLLRVQAARQLDESTFMRAARAHAALFSNDDSTLLINLHLHTVKGEPNKLIAVIDRIHDRVGGDPFLMVLRAEANFELDKLAAAKADAGRALGDDPELLDARRVLFLLALREREFAAAIDQLNRIGPTAAQVLEEARADPAFERFAGSAEYGEWARRHAAANKPVPAAPADAAQPPGALPRTRSLDLGKGVKVELVLIPAGEFAIGSDPLARKPGHKVRIERSFYIGKHEVTQAQWRAVMGTNPSIWKGDNRPVENVTWDDCQQFVRKVSQRTGEDVRLPSNAQWEYALRAGSSSPFHFGDDEKLLDQHAWYGRKGGAGTRIVGQKRPNAWGVHDMLGNVWEWTQDTWHSDYLGAPTDGSAWNTGGRPDLRVVRGGGWGDADSRTFSSANAPHEKHTVHTDALGFRMVLLPGGADVDNARAVFRRR